MKLRSEYNTPLMIAVCNKREIWGIGKDEPDDPLIKHCALRSWITFDRTRILVFSFGEFGTSLFTFLFCWISSQHELKPQKIGNYWDNKQPYIKWKNSYYHHQFNSKKNLHGVMDSFAILSLGQLQKKLQPLLSQLH